MHILDAVWTPVINLYRIKCDWCNTVHLHRADRWWVKCPNCNQSAHLGILRDVYTNKTVAE